MTSCGRRGERVRANRGAAGVDRVTLAAVEAYGVERMLDELATRPPCRCLPSGAGAPGGDPQARRPQAAVGYSDCAGPGVPAGGQDRPRADLRGRLSCPAASGSARSGRPPMPWSGSGWRSLEGSSLSSRPTSATSSARSTTRGCSRWSRERVSDRRVLKLVRQWLRAGVLVDGVVSETVTGTPQGGVISPAAGQHLSARLRQGLGRARHWRSRPLRGRLRVAVRLPGAGRGGSAAGNRATGRARSEPACGQDPCGRPPPRAGRALTSSVAIFRPACRAGCGSSGEIVRYYLHRWPSQRSMKRARARVKALTGRSQVGWS